MIFDTFIFYNELDLLEIRLQELGSAVDKFVLVESTHNLRGEEKPLYYEIKKERFSQWGNKIVHVVMEGYPEKYLPDTIEAGRVWFREFCLRERIKEGLKAASDEDLVLISDVDEIPSAVALKQVVALKQDHPVSFHLVDCSFYVDNWLVGAAEPKRQALGAKAVLVRYGLLKHTSAQIMRNASHKFPFAVMSGWHFSWVGGAERVREKMKTFSHTELDREENTNPQAVARMMRTGIHPSASREMFLELDVHYGPMPIGGRLPAHLTRERYPHLFRPTVAEAPQQEEEV